MQASRAVLITDASRGFGTETALYLAEHGFRVYAGTSNRALEDWLRATAQCRHVELRVLRLAVTDQASIDAAVRTIVAEAGGIYGVVNTAYAYVRGYFEDLRDDECREVIETNVFGTMALTRAVLPHMRAAYQGRIILITSIAGRIGGPSACAYSASRFAQEGFAESLSQEVQPLGLYVSIIAPGMSMAEAWTIADGAGAQARDPKSPYHGWFVQVDKMFASAMQSSATTSVDVARTVHHALTVRKPRLRYLVSHRGTVLLALRRYVPGKLFERYYFGTVMRRITRTP